MSPEGHHSIGEVLALLQEEFPDVTISKIRFLEKEGLIDPERTPSGYRKFYDDDVACLRWILRQQRENYLPLKVIRERISSGAWQDDDAAAPEAVPAAEAAAEPARPLTAVEPLTPAPAPAPVAAVADERPMRAVEPLDTGMTGVSLTVDELAAASGLDGDTIAELTRYGLLAGPPGRLRRALRRRGTGRGPSGGGLPSPRRRAPAPAHVQDVRRPRGGLPRAAGQPDGPPA